MATLDELMASIPVGASLQDLEKLKQATDADTSEDVDAEALGRFASEAADQQRINLRLRNRKTGESFFWNAGDVLSGRLAEQARGGASVPERFATAVTEASRRFVAAAESVVQWHRTRLYVQPTRDPSDPYCNGMILEWKESTTGPAVDELPLSELMNGRRPGRGRVSEPSYHAALDEMSGAAATLLEALGRVASSFDAELAIRTFEPAAEEAAG
jgi:hypothetical protein